MEKKSKDKKEKYKIEKEFSDEELPDLEDNKRLDSAKINIWAKNPFEMYEGKFKEHNEDRPSTEGPTQDQTPDEINYHVSKQHSLHICPNMQDENYIYISKEHNKKGLPSGRIMKRIKEEIPDGDKEEGQINMNRKDV